MKFRLCPLIFLCVLTASSSALAQPSSKEMRSEAYQQGWNALKAEDYAEAERIFGAMYAEERTFDVALNLAHAELMLDKYPEAATHFQVGLKTAPPGANHEMIARCRQGLELIKKQHVATVKVEVNQSGAQVSLDGVPVGSAPLNFDVFVKPGKHTIEASLSGHEPARREMQVIAGEEVPLTLSLIKLVPAVTPAEAPRAQESGGKSNAEDGNHTLPLVLAGGAVVGIGAGIGFLVAAGSARSETETILGKIEVSPACGAGTPYVAECSRARELEDEARTSQAIGFAALGAGVVAAGAALVLYLTQEDGAADGHSGSGVRFIPSIAPGSFGATLTTSFSEF